MPLRLSDEAGAWLAEVARSRGCSRNAVVAGLIEREREVSRMLVALHPDQEALLRQMAADVDVEPEELLVLLVSDRLTMEPLALWRA